MYGLNPGGMRGPGRVADRFRRRRRLPRRHVHRHQPANRLGLFPGCMGSSAGVSATCLPTAMPRAGLAVPSPARGGSAERVSSGRIGCSPGSTAECDGSNGRWRHGAPGCMGGIRGHEITEYPLGCLVPSSTPAVRQTGLRSSIGSNTSLGCRTPSIGGPSRGSGMVSLVA